MQAVDFSGKWSVVLGVQLDVVPHTSRSMCGRNHTVDKTQFLFDIKRLGSVGLQQLGVASCQLRSTSRVSNCAYVAVCGQQGEEQAVENGIPSKGLTPSSPYCLFGQLTNENSYGRRKFSNTIATTQCPLPSRQMWSKRCVFRLYASTLRECNLLARPPSPRRMVSGCGCPCVPADAVVV